MLRDDLLSGDHSGNSSVNGIEDVYLAVMGVTGAGKSSFIKLCTNKNVVIGHNLKSCLFPNRALPPVVNAAVG